MDSHKRSPLLRTITVALVTIMVAMAIPVRASAAFVPLDIPLSEELQKHLYQSCEDYNVPYAIMLAIIEHESRYIWQPARLDVNGLYSVGFCQINYPHWKRLMEDYGVDVRTEKGNIEAGIIILSELLEKYETEKALVAYQCGITGAAGIESTEFSRWILERSKELCVL